MSYQQGYEDGVRATKAEFLKLYEEEKSQEKYLSLQKTEDGELVAVTYTDDEHRIIEVLWERPPAKTLTADEQLVLMMELLNWNRSLDEPLIKIAHEGGVALKVLELLTKAQE